MKTFKGKHGLPVILAMCLLMTPFYALASGSPVEAFKKLGQAAIDKDWGAFWDGCEKTTKQTMARIFLFGLALGSMEKPEIQERMEKEFGHLKDNPKADVDKATFIKIMTLVGELDDDDVDPSDYFASAKIVEKERKENKAILTVTSADKKPEEITMVLEDGQWKFYMPNPFEQGAPPTPPAADAGQGAAPPPSAGADQPTQPAEPGQAPTDEEKGKSIIKKFFK